MSAELPINAARALGDGGLLPSPRRGVRIMTTIHSFEPGGVERVAMRLHAAWQAMGVDARLLVGRGGGAGQSLADGLDCRIIPGGDHVTRRGRMAWMIRHLPAIIREERPDVLFCPGNTYSSIGAAMKLALRHDCPPVVNKVSNDYRRADLSLPLRLGYHAWLRIPGALLDRFVAMEPAMTREIETLAGVPPRRIAVINDPVLRRDELARLAALPRRPSPGGRRFLAIGRLMPQKNFALLIDAFARVALPDDRLTILGEGPQRTMLTEMAATLGVGDRITMPGHVTDIMPWLADADIFVMSSDYEGVPAVLIEAIAARLSVIATDCSAAMASLTGHGLFGALVPVGDVTALAQAIAAACPSRPEAPQIAAINAHVEQFTVEAGARAYLSLMADLVERRAATPVPRLVTA